MLICRCAASFGWTPDLTRKQTMRDLDILINGVFLKEDARGTH